MLSEAGVAPFRISCSVPIYFYGDLDAYTLQNIYRTLKGGISGKPYPQ